MFFDQNAIDSQIAAMKSGLNDPAFIPDMIAELKKISESLNALGYSERAYLGNTSVMDIEKELHPKTITRQMAAEQVTQRRAKRKADAAAWKLRQEDEKRQREVARLDRRLNDARIAQELRERRQSQRPGQIRAAKEKPVKGEGLAVKSDKVFEPVIGKPNAAGEIPVKVAYNTTIMVKPGRDVQKTIAKFQNYLKSKL